MKEITLPAVLSNIEPVTEFVNEVLEAADCPMKAQVQLDIAIDELFNNISQYAYEPGSEEAIATVRIEIIDTPRAGARLTFVDQGKPYDPLSREDPDITLSAEERKIGGLGIYMVKKSMDQVIYEYANGQNILTLTKFF